MLRLIRRPLTLATAAALSLGLALPASAADSLTIGDEAPPVDVEHWLSGEADERNESASFEEGQVYLVEFWATWCGPCIMSMPHLVELKAEHGDNLHIMSISDEPLKTVRAFLDREVPPQLLEEGDAGREDADSEDDAETTTFGELTSAYALATDPDESVKNDYMRAAGERGIPSSFIVGKTGQVEWIGHPMAADDVIAKVIAGTWDRERAREIRGLESSLEEIIDQVGSPEADPKTLLAKLDAIEARIDGESDQTAQLAMMVGMARGQLMRATLLKPALTGDAKAQEKLLVMASKSPRELMGLAGEVIQSRNVLGFGEKPDPAFAAAVIELAASKAKQADESTKELYEGEPSDAALYRISLMQLLASQKRYDEAAEAVQKVIDDPSMAGNERRFVQMRENYRRMAKLKVLAEKAEKERNAKRGERADEDKAKADD